MKHLTKRLLALTAALALTFSLAACGAPAQESETTETTETTESAETTETAPEEEAEAPAEEATVGQSEESEPAADHTTIRVAALKGPTAIGMLDLMEKDAAQESANDYEFSLVAAPDEMTGKIVSGEVDIAAVPTNLAPVLYKKTEGAVQMAALNTMGVLYVVEKGDTVSSVADLAGKTILSSGQGSVPEYAFNAILSKNGIDPASGVNVVYKTEHSEVAAGLASGEATIAVLPQPFVTTVTTKQPDVRVALDLTEEWNKVYPESGLTMGCVVVRSEFAQQHPEELNAFLDEYRASAEAANDPENLEHTAQLCADQDLFPKEVAMKAIPECNIVFKEGDEMKQIASGFFQVLFDANPQSVGGSLPDDGLYYQR